MDRRPRHEDRYHQARRDAVKTARECEEQFHAIFDHSFQFISLIRPDGRILEMNQTTLDFFHIDKAEIIGKHFWDSPWIASTAEREWLHESVNIAAQGEFLRFETSALRPDGQHVFLDLSITPIKDDQGKTQFLIMEGRDRSIYKKIEEALRESENKYHTIFETSKTALAILENDTVIIEINKEFERLSGYTADEVVGKTTWMDFVPSDQLHTLKFLYSNQDQEAGSTSDSYETTLLAKDGKRIEGLVVTNLIPDINQRVISFLDLTALKHAQRLMFHTEKMAALGNIMAGVAHEINNPNNFIYFNLPVLRDYIKELHSVVADFAVKTPQLTLMGSPYDAFFSDVFQLLADMEYGSSRITGIVSELKNYIRGYDEEQKQPGNIATVVQHTVTLVKKQVQKMVAHFEVNVAENLPPVLMNSGKIEQVLINLIINAGQAADKENSWIRVTATTDKQGAHVLISVEDNGAGIPDTIQDRIFEPFFTTRARESGIGLGLATSQRIIEEHNGQICLHTTYGQGTSFTVQFPIYQGEDR